MKSANNIKILKNGGVTSPNGFLANGIHCGIKSGSKKDLCLIYSAKGSASSGVFTTNKVKAAPVRISQMHLRKSLIKAVIVNSGNANACNGKKGWDDALEMVKTTASSLNIKSEEVFVASTGKIGVKLPIGKIKKAIKKLSSAVSPNGGHNSALAILTTDRVTKEIGLEFTIGKKKARLGGMSKGAGMISPDLATMLCFLTTDINIESGLLKKAFKKAVDNSFNLITVDGDQSTNDSVVILANGSAGNKKIEKEGRDFKLFEKALNSACQYLAKEIIRDGEGATKIVKVIVLGSKTKMDAKKIAFAIANSNLVKTSIFGKDPNWGRVIAAVGYSGAEIKEEKIDIYYGKHKVVKNGQGKKENYLKAKKALLNREIELKIDLNQGKENISVLTCDFSPEYVKINSKFKT